MHKLACGVPERQYYSPSKWSNVCIFNSTWASHTYTREDALVPSLVFPARFLTCKEMAHHCKTYQPFTLTQDFSISKPQLSFHPWHVSSDRKETFREWSTLAMQIGVKHTSRHLHLSKSQTRYRGDTTKLWKTYFRQAQLELYQWSMSTDSTLLWEAHDGRPFSKVLQNLRAGTCQQWRQWKQVSFSTLTFHKLKDASS